VEEVLTGFLNGIDFADEPGIEGAGVEAVFEELHSEEVPMALDLSKLTLEDLQKARPDLLQEYAASVLEAHQGAANDAAVAALTEEKTALSAQVQALQTQLADTKFMLAVAEAAQIGVGRKIYEKLKADVATIEEIAAKLPAIRTAALEEFTAGSAAETKPKGDAHPKAQPDEDEGEDEDEDEAGARSVTEEQSLILGLLH